MFKALCPHCPFDTKKIYTSYRDLHTHVHQEHPTQAEQYPARPIVVRLFS